MIRRPPRSTPLYSSAASDVYKRQDLIITGLTVAGLALLVLKQQSAMAAAAGVDPSQVPIENAAAAIGIDANAFARMGIEAAINVGVRAAIPWAYAKQLFDLLMRGEDVIGLVHLYARLDPNNEMLQAADRIATSVESSPYYETYKENRDQLVTLIQTTAGVVGGIGSWIWDFVNPECTHI